MNTEEMLEEHRRKIENLHLRRIADAFEVLVVIAIARANHDGIDLSAVTGETPSL